MSFRTSHSKSVSRRDSRDFSSYETTLVDPPKGRPGYELESAAAMAADTIDSPMDEMMWYLDDDEQEREPAARDTHLEVTMTAAPMPTPTRRPVAAQSSRRSESALRTPRVERPESARAQWTQNARQARRSLTSRRHEREALAKVIALSKPRERPTWEQPRSNRRRPFES